MTVTTTTTPVPASLAPATVDPPALGLRTLIEVELRKMTDTRSGRWILAAIIAVVGGALGWKLAHPAVELSFHNYGGAAATFVAYGAPLIGLLAMTSEWTQRTALTTFTLAPRR